MTWVGTGGSQDPAGRAGGRRGEVPRVQVYTGDARLSLSVSVFPRNASQRITGTANRNRNRHRNGKAAAVTVTAGLDD